MGGKVPVMHEVSTSFKSLEHAMNGKPRKARKAWKKYAQESVIGSGVYAAGLAMDGNEEKAREIAKGMARATGTTVCGGGVLSDVPVFKELSKCGLSLGDAMCGENAQARKRWTQELVQEYQDPDLPLKAATSAMAFTAAGGAATFCGTTAGLPAPAVMVAGSAAANNAAASSAAASSTTVQAVGHGAGAHLGPASINVTVGASTFQRPVAASAATNSAAASSAAPQAVAQAESSSEESESDDDWSMDGRASSAAASSAR